MFTLKIPMSGDKITGGDQKWFLSMWLDFVGRGGEGRSKTLEDVAACSDSQRWTFKIGGRKGHPGLV